MSTCLFVARICVVLRFREEFCSFFFGGGFLVETTVDHNGALGLIDRFMSGYCFDVGGSSLDYPLSPSLRCSFSLGL